MVATPGSEIAPPSAWPPSVPRVRVVAGSPPYAHAAGVRCSRVQSIIRSASRSARSGPTAQSTAASQSWCSSHASTPTSNCEG